MVTRIKDPIDQYYGQIETDLFGDFIINQLYASYLVTDPRSMFGMDSHGDALGKDVFD